MVVVIFVVVEGVFKVCLAAQPVKRTAAVMYFIMIFILCGLIFCILKRKPSEGIIAFHMPRDPANRHCDCNYPDL